MSLFFKIYPDGSISWFSWWFVKFPLNTNLAVEEEMYSQSCATFGIVAGNRWQQGRERSDVFYLKWFMSSITLKITHIDLSRLVHIQPYHTETVTGERGCYGLACAMFLSDSWTDPAKNMCVCLCVCGQRERDQKVGRPEKNTCENSHCSRCSQNLHLNRQTPNSFKPRYAVFEGASLNLQTF